MDIPNPLYRSSHLAVVGPRWEYQGRICVLCYYFSSPLVFVESLWGAGEDHLLVGRVKNTQFRFCEHALFVLLMVSPHSGRQRTCLLAEY